MRRLRAAYTPEQLARIYADAHDRPLHVDHLLRMTVTIAIACEDGPVGSVADLSCDAGQVINAIPADRRVCGDLVPGWEYCGPLEETVTQIDPVDLFVCTETIEHLDDPLSVLRQIREKTHRLILSTPVDAWADPNPEHYWAWDRKGVEQLLSEAGFTVKVFNALDFRPRGSWYRFGIWSAV